jgi:DNA-binding transcriptional LysR family regulator
MANFLRSLEIRHLAVLQAVAEAGSFWSAADRLDLSPSAVSQQIAMLESVAGERLVERSRGRRRVELTEAGRLLAGHAGAIVARVRAAESDFAAFRKGTTGTLRVGTYQSIGARVLPRLLPRFALSWPGVEVRLAEGLSDAALMQKVETGELDLTFTTFPIPAGALDGLRLLEDPYVLTVARESRLARLQRPIALRELNEVKLLGVATCEAEVVARFRTLGLKPDIRFPSADNAVVQGLAAAGVGASIAPLLTVDQTDDRVVIVPVRDMPARTLGLAWHADRYHSPAFKAFRQAAVEVCAQLEKEIGAYLGR